ncbi:CHAT domain-containing protein [Nostoc sp. 106C]|uniref:CHAT domain-containing protein n=1 Tax=Nostoc sp. 106C TaxID=1932667 RepID=UPI000A3ABB4E|nr:CHAT domain-containing protein [Nostoc sp. 106C]OUL28509.1 hypothetical protein BV375_17555 [Nostoc sp. 106C]
MKLLNLYLTPINEARFKVIARSSAGQAEANSRLPFFENRDKWRTTLIKMLEVNEFRPSDFQNEGEQDWMVKVGILTKDKSNFNPPATRLKKIGQHFYKSLFPAGEVREVLQKMIALAEASNTQLHIQLEFNANVTQYSRLPDYPWELVHDSQKFLAHHRVTFSRYIAHSTKPPSLPLTNKINILLVSSTAFDEENGLLPLSKKEQQAILKGLAKAQETGDISLTILEPPTLNCFRAYLTENRGDKTPHVFHFDGHGFFGKRCDNQSCRTIHRNLKAEKCKNCGATLPSNPQGYLVFENEQEEADYVSAQEIGTLLQKTSFGDNPNQQAGVALAVLSACKAAMALGGDSVFNGVAQNLINHQVPAVVAMQYTIRVDSAVAFAEHFYRSLSQKNTLVTVVSHAREVMGTTDNQWYRLVLYLRWQDNEGGQLFASPVSIKAKDIVNIAERENQAEKALSTYEPVFVVPSQDIFVGQEEILEAIVQHALNREYRLLTLYSGIGGIGKTAVACCVAQKLKKANYFKDGIAFIELQETKTVESLVLKTILVLKLKNISTRDELIGQLQNKIILIIYDNIEDIVSNDASRLNDFFTEILKWTTVSIICTGREYTNISEEKLFEIKPLTKQQNKDLFIKLIKRKINLEVIDNEIIDKIVSFCDGIPLIVHLISSWFPRFSLAEYLEDFNTEKSLALRNAKITEGDKTTNYEISTKLTYEKLTKEEQKFFRYICLLPVHPTKEMLPESTEESIRQIIRELRSWNLLSEVSEELRVLIPVREVIRQFANEEEKLKIATSIINYFLNNQELKNHQNTSKFIIQQHNNLTFAILTVLNDETNIYFNNTMLAIMKSELYYTQKGLLKEATEILEYLISKAEKNQLSIPYQIYAYQGNVFRLQSLDAITPYAKALDCVNDEIQKAKVLLGLANAQKTVLQYSQAKSSFEEALQIFQKHYEFPREQAECLWGLANVNFATSQWQNALGLYTKSLEIYERLTGEHLNIKGQIDCLKGMCDIYIKKREYNQAQTVIFKAHELYYTSVPPFINKVTEAKIQQGMGDISKLIFINSIEKDKKDSESDYLNLSEAAYSKAIKLYHEMLVPVGEALSYYKLAELYVFSHSLQESEILFRKSEKIFSDYNYVLGILKSQLALQKISLISELATPEMIKQIQTLLNLAQNTCKSKYWQAECLIVLAVCHIKLSYLTQGYLLLSEAENIFASLKRTDKIDIIKNIYTGSYTIYLAFQE